MAQPRGDKTGADELRARLQRIEDEWLASMDEGATIRWAVRTLGVSRRTAQRYMRAVLKLHRKVSEREHRRAMHRASIKRRIRIAEDAGEYGPMMTGLKLLAQIDGVLTEEQKPDEPPEGAIETAYTKLGQWTEPPEE